MGVTEVGNGLPLFLVTVLKPLPNKTSTVTSREYQGYPNCTRDKVNYLMRLLQTDPEKVMRRDC